MTKAEEYRVHARYCAIAARFVSSDVAKRVFAARASAWLKRAERAEVNARRAKRQLKIVN